MTTALVRSDKVSQRRRELSALPSCGLREAKGREPLGPDFHRISLALDTGTRPELSATLPFSDF